MRSEIALLPAILLMLSLGGCDRASQSGEQAATVDEVTVDEVVSEGDDEGTTEVFSAKIDRDNAGAPLPDIAITAPDGTPMKLSDLKGKPLVVNLWAVWCAPCVAEMPTLQALRQRYARKGVQVIAVSQDTNGAAAVDPKIAERKLDPAMVRYLDTESALSFHYGTGLLPTTILYNAKGQETARVVGAMDWSGQQAAALVTEALK